MPKYIKQLYNPSVCFNTDNKGYAFFSAVKFIITYIFDSYMYIKMSPIELYLYVILCEASFINPHSFQYEII